MHDDKMSFSFKMNTHLFKRFLMHRIIPAVIVAMKNVVKVNKVTLKISLGI